MHEDVLKINALWKRDQARDALLAEKSALDAAVADATRKRDEKLAILDARRATLKELKTAERDHTHRMESYIKRRDRSIKAIETGTATDYHAAQAQVEQCAAIADQEETIVLGLYEQVEAAEAAVANGGRVVEAAEATLSGAEERRARRLPSLMEELTAATVERDGAREGIWRDQINRYDKLRKAGKQAMAAVDAGVCRGCNVKLNGTIASEHRRGVKLVICPSCGRFLGELI